MQKLWTLVLVGALMTVAFPLPARAQSVARLQSGYGLCIQPVAGGVNWNGEQIHQVPCDPYDPSYFWRAVYVRDFDGKHWFHIVNQNNGLCLDLTDGITADWNALQLWECNRTSTTMLWNYNPVGNTRFINARSRKCMDVRGGSSLPGTLIQNYRCVAIVDGQPNLAQIWNWR